MRRIYKNNGRISGSEEGDMKDAQATITRAVLQWPGVTTVPHRFGGTEYRLGDREIGHIHGDGLVDIPFPRKVRDELIAAGRAEEHHILPASGWVSLQLRKRDDVENAIEMLKISFDRATAQASRGSHGGS
jgi:hypothetical protein